MAGQWKCFLFRSWLVGDNAGWELTNEWWSVLNWSAAAAAAAGNPGFLVSDNIYQLFKSYILCS